MNLIKLGKKGQVSIPQGVLRQLGIAPGSPLLVETTADGAIVLRQVSVHPVEIYSEERLAEFARENAMTPAQARQFGPQLTDFNAWLQRQAQARRAAPHAAESAAAYADQAAVRDASASGLKAAAPVKPRTRRVAPAVTKKPASRGAKR